jgi:Zn-dependent protease
MAYFLIQNRRDPDESFGWSAAQYVLGFAIVLLHEFGHVLACRQVGGTAERVVLWPLGGLALAHPPPRPGALLWTVAAGPLVNVVLLPISLGMIFLSGQAGWESSLPEVHRLVMMLSIFNLVILIFNLLPIYPLDGGQILQALLWFVIGRAMSLKVVSVIGLVAGGGLIVLAVFAQEWFGAVMALFLVFASLGGFARAKMLSQMDRVPRRPGLACPSCGAAPPVGPFWRCQHCLTPFDLFAPATACPRGGSHTPQTACLDCGRDVPMHAWLTTPVAGPNDEISMGPFASPNAAKGKEW